jgi:hypothetical protein
VLTGCRYTGWAPPPFSLTSSPRARTWWWWKEERLRVAQIGAYHTAFLLRRAPPPAGCLRGLPARAVRPRRLHLWSRSFATSSSRHRALHSSPPRSAHSSSPCCSSLVPSPARSHRSLRSRPRSSRARSGSAQTPALGALVCASSASACMLLYLAVLISSVASSSTAGS